MSTIGKEIPYGYCHCGCGEKTNIAKRNYIHRGKSYRKGEPIKYLPYHQHKHCRVHKQSGHCYVYEPNHPKTINRKGATQIPVTYMVVEALLNKYLPEKTRIWHYDGNPNSLKNIVVCNDFSYMSLLIQRKKAYEVCGHAKYRKCAKCKEYDDPINMVRHSQRGLRHRTCHPKEAAL